MAGILKVDKYQDFNGNDIMTSDGAGNITLNNAALKNTPSFFAYLSSNQSFTQNINTKVQFQSELYDTDSCYDNTTNYRFTPTVAGKYFFFTSLYIDGTTTSSPTGSYFYKNGTKWSVGLLYSGGLAGQQTSNIILDMNGSSDYVEVYVNSGNPSPFLGATAGGQMSSYFGGYKIMGA